MQQKYARVHERKQNLVLEPLEFAFNWNIKQVQGCISLKYARKFETFRHAYPF